MTGSILIRSVRLSDPSGGGEPRRDVLVVDGRIARVAKRIIVTREDRVLDGDGRFLFPGLVDAHVHLCFDPDRHPEDWLPEAADRELEAVVAHHALRSLQAGVTTVRDLGSRGSSVRRVRARIERGELVGPRILVSGPVITQPGGHCHFIGDTPGSRAQMVGVVDEHRRHGDDWIKVMVTGGAMTKGSDPNTIQWTEDQTTYLVGNAESRGLSTAAHVLSREGARIAIHAGARTIEHGVDLGPEELSEMRRRGQVLVPVLSPSMLLLANSESADPQHVAKLRGVVELLHATTRRAVEEDVRIAVGTDAGCPAVPHGEAVRHEIAALEALGMSRTASLLAATDPTPLTGGSRCPPFAVGQPADLLVLDTDPRRDLAGLGHPHAVVVRGLMAPAAVPPDEGVPRAHRL